MAKSPDTYSLAEFWTVIEKYGIKTIITLYHGTTLNEEVYTSNICVSTAYDFIFFDMKSAKLRRLKYIMKLLDGTVRIALLLVMQ